MSEIIVSEEQAQLISKAREPVRVRDASGRILGVISPIPTDESPEEIEEIKRRMRIPQPAYSTQEVLDHLRSLEAK